MLQNISPVGAPVAAQNIIISNARTSKGAIHLELCGRSWELTRPDDLETLWNSMTDEAFADDERLPYWVELWPASIALGALLYKNKERIAGQNCLDVGCGLGFTSLVASWLGARVVAMDYEAEAVAYARKNAVINAVPQPCWTVMDWRAPAVQEKSCAFIWGGDVMYERRFVAPVFDFLEHALAPDGTVWLAEPGRTIFAPFKEALTQRGWQAHCIAKDSVEPLHVQKTMVSVNLWKLSRAASM